MLVYYMQIFKNYFYSIRDIMTVIMEHSYIYNLSWEDSAVDRRLLNIGKNDIIAGITTGGDNIINYLIDNPLSIYTADINKYQNYLLELKINMMRVFTQQEFFDVFNSKQIHPLFISKLEQIKGGMSDGAKEWIDKNKHIMNNFIYTGSVKYVAYIMYYIFHLTGLVKIAECNTLQEQREFMKGSRFQFVMKMIDMILWNRVMISIICPLIGVPERQINLMNDETNFPSNCIKYVLSNFLLKHNYFYNLYLGNPLSNECCPEYLKKENYDIVKSRLDRIHIRRDYIQNVVQTISPTKVILLDHMDWLDEESIVKEWSVYKKSCPNAVFLWRSASKKQYIGSLDRLNYIHRFRLNHTALIGTDGPEQNADSIGADRIGMYLSTYVATIPKDVLIEPVNIPNYHISSIEKLKVFLQMMFAPFAQRYSSYEKFLNHFYSSQAKYYDAYRQQMLHGKRPLMSKIPYNRNDRILILGAGTGDLIDYLPNTDKFAKITLVDLCLPLLEKAKERITGLGSPQNIDIVHVDATKYSDLTRYDIVIITYALTMIPNWRDIIPVIKTNLRPGGYLAISDFTVRDDSLYSRFWKRIFASDNVNLNKQHIDEMNRNFNLIDIEYQYGSFPFVPYLKCPYYYGLWKA